MKNWRFWLFVAAINLITVCAVAQGQSNNADKFEKVNLPSEDLEIITTAFVVEIINGKARLQSSKFAKNFKVPQLDLVAGKEYKFRLLVDPELKKKLHCTGCTGILDAQIIGYALTPRQAKKDFMQFAEENDLGYDRSPRGH